mgnify:CR=1 FL=1
MNCERPAIFPRSFFGIKLREDNYIVDFYCTNCNVVIEIDGSSHNGKEDYDAKRDEYLESLGLTVIHIPVTEVMNNLNGVMEILYQHPALLECRTENK